MKNNNTENNIMNYKDALEAADEQSELGKKYITDIAMTCGNDYTVIDSLMCILELFAVKDADVSVRDLVAELQDYLFRWTKEYGNSVDAWKDSVLYGTKYKDAPAPEAQTQSEQPKAKTLAEHHLQIMANKISHIMRSNKVSDDAKDAFHSIIVDASNEARTNVGVSNPEVIKIAFPLLIESLECDYGRGVVHSLTSLLDSSLVHSIEDELRQYEKRFDGRDSELGGKWHKISL
jgi:hypothetical protein